MGGVSWPQRGRTVLASVALRGVAGRLSSRRAGVQHWCVEAVRGVGVSVAGDVEGSQGEVVARLWL